MKVAIVGSRDYPNRTKVSQRLRLLQQECGAELSIISGGARGVDTWARDWAVNHDVPVTEILADWNTHGKAAGFIRNEEIVAAADRVIAFWDGQSKGTKNDIGLALKGGKDLEVVFP